MSETTVILWMAFFFMLRFALPLFLAVGSGRLWNRVVENAQ